MDSLRDALAASWSSPLTPLTEARGYLVVACSTEQTHRSKRLIAQVLRQAAATNRTFVEPGVAGSHVAEPWASRVAVCGTAAAGGARLYWDMPHLREAALGLGTDAVALDALGSRVAELLGSGVPPPGFDRIIDLLPCRADLGVCAQGSGQAAVVDRTVASYEQALAKQLQSAHSRAYVVVLGGFNQDPRVDAATDSWFRPSPVLRRAAAEAVCEYGLDPCACEGASCRAGGFVAVHWRAETSLAFRVPGGLTKCSRLLGETAEAAAAELTAELEWSGNVAVDAHGSVLPREGAPLFLLSDLPNGTYPWSANFPAESADADARRRAASALERRFDRQGRMPQLRAWLRGVGTAIDSGVRSQLELAIASRAGRLVADVRPYGSQVPRCPSASESLAPCACTAGAGSASASALGEYFLLARADGRRALPTSGSALTDDGLITWLPSFPIEGATDSLEEEGDEESDGVVQEESDEANDEEIAELEAEAEVDGSASLLRPEAVGSTASLLRRLLFDAADDTQAAPASGEKPLHVNYIVATTHAHMHQSRTCGGCTLLHILTRQLQKLQGHDHVAVLPMTSDRSEMPAACARARQMLPGGTSSAAVVVYPEGEAWSCMDPQGDGHARLVHVRWILAPMGMQSDARVTDSWGRTDLVFNYGQYAATRIGVSRSIPHSNLLSVILNPYSGDGFSAKQHKPQPRAGVVFMMRKADLAHRKGTLKTLHQTDATELYRNTSMAQHITAFRTHKYFVCYDPWSYYLVIAAMLGCITIVHPISGMTKREWLGKTWLGGWLEDTGAADVSGFAYGWDEAEYAERTMNRTRLEMYAWKQFAHGVTVPRFMRDAERAAMGRDDFEGALRAEALYPLGWWQHHPAFVSGTDHAPG